MHDPDNETHEVDPTATTLSALVPLSMAGSRLDVIAAGLFPEFSRSKLSEWIKSGRLTLDGATARPRDTLTGGDGHDTLQGERGNDEMQGGAGSDDFVFKGTILGNDTISDFDFAFDAIVFDGQTSSDVSLQKVSGGYSVTHLHGEVLVLTTDDLDANSFTYT